MTFEFTSQLDPVTKEPIDLKFESSDFRKLEDEGMAKALFKSAANSEIKRNRGLSTAKDISVKY